MKTVYVIDVESGNLQSLFNAIKRIGGYDVKFIHDAKEFADYNDSIEKLIFPGVGNYAHFIKQLHNRELVDPITSVY